MMIIWIKITISFIAFITLTACSASIQPPVVTKDLTPSPKPDSTKYLPSNLTDLYFSVLLNYKDNYKNRWRYAVQFKGPSDIKIELFPTTSFFQLAELVVKEDYFWYKNKENSNSYQGLLDENVLHKIFGLDFSIKELVSLILQKVPSDINNSESYTDKNENLFIFSKNSDFIARFNKDNDNSEFYYLRNNQVYAKTTNLRQTPDCTLIIEIPKHDLTIDINCISFKNDKAPSF